MKKERSKAGLVFPVSCFVLIVVSRHELMAFANMRYDVQLAEPIHDTG